MSSAEFQNKFDLLELLDSIGMASAQNQLVGVTMQDLEDEFPNFIEDGVWGIMQDEDHQSASEELEALETLSDAFGLYFDLDEARDHVLSLEQDYEPDADDRLERTFSGDEPGEEPRSNDDPVDLLFAGLDD